MYFYILKTGASGAFTDDVFQPHLHINNNPNKLIC